jgi:protein-tyrosine phosphatase
VSFVGLDCDDDDESEASWLSLSARLAELLATLEQHFSGGGHVLLCDATGFSTCAAVLSAYLLLRRHQTRFESAELLLCQARPSVYMSVSHKKGLRGLQARLDGLRMKRLDSKLRTSPMVSIAF